MNWSYSPQTEEECQKSRFSILDNGVYEARIEKVETKQSSKGNPMIVADLVVFGANGEGQEVKDFLVSTKQMMWKLKHLCDSAGLAKEYMEGHFHPDMLVSRMVKAQIGLQIGSRIPDDKLNGKAPGSMYPNKNICEDYIEDKTGFESITKKDDAPFIDDDSLPF